MTRAGACSTSFLYNSSSGHPYLQGGTGILQPSGTALRNPWITEVSRDPSSDRL